LGNLESEIKGTMKIKNDLDYIESRDFLAGSCIWSFHDYGTEYKPVWPIQTSGVVDMYRRYKEAAYFLKARWSEEPFIHIAGHWTWSGNKGKEKNVYVWHNCDKVELFLNGKKLTNHQVNEDFWKLIYEPGELKAVGKKTGKTVSHIIKTANDPTKIVLYSKDKILKSDGYDAFPIIAEIMDDNGTVIPTNDEIIKFTISGGAKLIGIGGKTETKTAAGSAAILIQSTGEKQEIIIQAETENLKSEKYLIRIND
jgi:beta-galactosidase